jgi:hypothetical protein
VGATIMGRNMFGGHPGGWDAEAPWNGWWGDDPPFHHPVFVLTPTMPASRWPARAAPPSRSSPTGSHRHSSKRGRRPAVAPTLLGGGERLFEGLGGDDLHGLEPRRSVAAPAATHLFFVKRES